MGEEKSSYRQIMKATSLFGGVQVINIIIAVIRSKFSAVLLGPAGMGFAGLLTSTTGLISALTSFGLSSSAVKSIASQNNDEKKVAKVIGILRKLVWITGLLGAFLTFFFAEFLSVLTFDSSEHTSSFRWLSITLLLNQLTSGQNVLLQGLRKLKYLAKANVIGSFVGLILSIPLYYLYGIEGVVPAIVLSSILALLIAYFFARKIKLNSFRATKKETITEGKAMLQLGFMLSLSGLITIGASHLLRLYIGNQGGLDDVGFYNAGFTIIGTYVGLVFTAMGTDYFPRLSSVASNNAKATELINQQAEIAILILAPILMVFLVFINWVIIILYSEEFTPINEMILWATLGMFFKAASWAIGFLFLAKGASQLFFWNELLANAYLLLLGVLGYYYFGLVGLGLSFLLTYILYFFQVFFISKNKYDFDFNSIFWRLFLIQFLIAVCCFVNVQFVQNPYKYLIGALLILISAWVSYKELDKRLHLQEMIFNLKKRLKNE